jgi:branched-chain amino acid transport system ATP-binding protein
MSAASMSEPTHAAPPLLQVEKLQKKFGGFTALNGVDLHVQPGERLGLIGPNGSGKSTFVNCVTGVLAHEGGVVRMGGVDLKKLPPH